MRRFTCAGIALLFGLLFAWTSFAAAPTYDATGEWDVTTGPLSVPNPCPGDSPIPEQFTLYIIQNGTSVTMVNVIEQSTSFGTVNDVTYTISDTWYEYDDEDGWFRVNETSTITADSDTQAHGTVTWTVPKYSCGGSSTMSLARRAQNPATFEATGTWQYTTSNADSWCQGADQPPASGTLTITQTGTKVTATTVINSQQVEYRGFLSGSTYTFMRSYPDDGGTVSQVFTIDLSNSGTGSGSCDWVWNDAYDDCGGRFDISMARAPLTITASAGSGGTISPSGSLSVAYGGSQTFTITPIRVIG